MTTAGADPNDRVIRRIEDWFVSRGVPHFIDGYSATHDVFTRALPVLTFLFLVEILGAVNLDWPWWANVAVLPAAFALLLAAWMLANRWRGRPLLQRPDELGVPELAAFVLAPALLPLVFGGQLVSAAVTALGNLTILAVIYLVTSYGLVPMTRWAAVQLRHQLASVLGLMARALPLVLLFGIFLMLSAEVWEISAGMEGPFFWAVAGLFFALGTMFLVSRLPREVRRLAAYAETDDLRQRLVGTPAEALPVHGALSEPPPLTWRQWGNLGLVLLFSQGLQVLLVSVLLGLFFVAFGLLAFRPETMAAWSGRSLAEPLATFELWGRDVRLTTELLRVSGFLAAFSGLYFSVTAVTDDTYRQEFYEDVVADVRQALAVRAAYLAVLRAGPDDALA
ncbi:MAG TPA: hypothetical protein VI854_06245 [Acidimicrobiia bacterium]|nr:hypothetical protein [Acidimicrobiia bacterium]